MNIVNFNGEAIDIDSLSISELDKLMEMVKTSKNKEKMKPELLQVGNEQEKKGYIELRKEFEVLEARHSKTVAESNKRKDSIYQIIREQYKYQVERFNELKEKTGIDEDYNFFSFSTSASKEEREKYAKEHNIDIESVNQLIEVSENIHFEDENAVEEFYSILEYNMGLVARICDEYTKRPDKDEKESLGVSKLLEEYNNLREELRRQESELQREIIYGSEAQPFYETNPTLYKYLRDNGIDLIGMCNFEGVKSILMQYGQYLGVNEENYKIEVLEDIQTMLENRKKYLENARPDYVKQKEEFEELEARHSKTEAESNKRKDSIYQIIREQYKYQVERFNELKEKTGIDEDYNFFSFSTSASKEEREKYAKEHNIDIESVNQLIEVSENIHFEDENAVEEFYSILEYNMGLVARICDEYTKRPDKDEKESLGVSKLLEEYNNLREELRRQESELQREIIYGSEAQPFYETNPILYQYLRDKEFDLTGMCNFEGVKSILMQYGQYLGISDEEKLEKNETEKIINQREGEEQEFSEGQAIQFFKTSNDYTNVPMATPIKKKWKEIIAEKIKELANKGKDAIDNMFR